MLISVQCPRKNNHNKPKILTLCATLIKRTHNLFKMNQGQKVLIVYEKNRTATEFLFYFSLQDTPDI